MKKPLNERFQELAGIKPLSAPKINELDFAQKTSGFFSKAKAALSNLVGKSAAGKDAASKLKMVGLPTSGFTAYITDKSAGGPNQWDNKYILDKWLPVRPDTLNQQVKVTQGQIDSWSEGDPFLAIQATFDLQDEEPKLKGKMYALNISNGKYDFIKEFEEDGARGLPGDNDDDSTIQAFKQDIEKFTQSPISITVAELMEKVGVSVPEGEKTPAGAPEGDAQAEPAAVTERKRSNKDLMKEIFNLVKKYKK